MKSTRNMNIFIVTDIFGINQHIKDLVKKFTVQTNSLITIVDPYKGSEQTFVDDDEAYLTFIKTCGHQSYAKQLKSKLKKITDQTIIIGFSAGASAAWQNSNETNKYVNQVIGFYPSQIRNQLTITPCCAVTLIFPIIEPHFNIDPVIEMLTKKQPVICLKTIYNHGFINPSSKNHSAKAAQYFTAQLVKLINAPEKHQLITEQQIHFVRHNNEN